MAVKATTITIPCIKSDTLSARKTADECIQYYHAGAENHNRLITDIEYSAEKLTESYKTAGGINREKIPG